MQAIIALITTGTLLGMALYLYRTGNLTQTGGSFLFGYLLIAGLTHGLIFVNANALLPSDWHQNWPYVLVILLVVQGLFGWLFIQEFLLLSVHAYWGVGLSFLFVIIATLIDINAVFLSSPLTTETTSVILTVFGLLVYGVFVSHSLWLMLVAVRQMHSPHHQNRILFVALGLAVSVFGVLLFLTGTSAVNQGLSLLAHALGAAVLVYLQQTFTLPNLRTSAARLWRIVILAIGLITLYFLILYGLIWFWLPALPPQQRLQLSLSAGILLVVIGQPLLLLLRNYLKRLLSSNRYDEREIINDYITATNNILVLNDLVTTAVVFLRLYLKISHAAFCLVTNSDDRDYHLAVYTEGDQTASHTFKLRRNGLLAQQLVDYGHSVSQYTIDMNPQYRQADPEPITLFQQQKFEQYVPVKRNNELIAILAVGAFNSGLPYNPKDVQLLKMLSNQSAIALENARLFSSVKTNLDEITRLKTSTDNIFASIASGVLTIDMNDRIVMLNNAARTILRLDAHIQAGEKSNQALGSLQNTPLPALLRDVKATQSSYTAFQMNAKIPNRGTVHLTVDISPIRDAQSEMTGIAIVFNDLTETHRLAAVQDLFRKYLSPAVVDRLPEDPEMLRLGGQRQTVTVLFADIRGFSTFSEFLEPEALINTLNQYLSMAAEAVLIYEGTLDKFMGDAVMAIFNAPLPQPDHTLRAVRAAVAMQRMITESHRRLPQDAPRLQFGVGIHTGEAVIGNVGTDARMDYTAIGDAVNLAKRLQENTPGGRILLSHAAYQTVKKMVNAVPHAELKVKGRRTTEPTYQVIGLK